MAVNFFKKNKNDGMFFDDVLSDVSRGQFFDEDNFEGRRHVTVARSSFWVLVGFIACVIAVSGTFAYRLFLLQVIDSEKYSESSFKNKYSSVPVLSVRGSISDRNGVVLARTQKVGTSTDDYERVYREAPGYGNVIGYVRAPKKDIKGVYWQDTFKGADGLELYYDQLLSGKSGAMYYEKNASGVKSEASFVEEPIHGKDITLSIDSELQEFVYKTLSDYTAANDFKAASGVMMDADTGEVLFLVSYPTYNPYELVQKKSTTTVSTSSTLYYTKLLADKQKPLLNRAVSGLYAPGSIVKPLFALAALEKGVITPNTSIFSAGQITVPSKTGGEPAVFKDWKAHGWTDLRKAIAVSSDVYFYSIVGGYEGQKGIGIDVVDEFTKAFGFDSPTGIDIFGEVSGNIPTPEWKEKVFKEAWRLGDTYNSSIGQFGFTVTPISMARYIAAIVNQGYLVTPKLLASGTSASSEVIKTKIAIDVDPKWYKVVQDGMRMTVTDGTAMGLNLPYVQVAAKTGTAEIGVKKDRINSWVVGFFPYEKPKYVFVLVAENGPAAKFQSTVVPAKEIFEWMNIYRQEYFSLPK